MASFQFSATYSMIDYINVIYIVFSVVFYFKYMCYMVRVHSLKKQIKFQNMIIINFKWIH